MSKLRGKLQIVISKIKYYWIIVSEVISSRLKQETVQQIYRIAFGPFIG